VERVADDVREDEVREDEVRDDEDVDDEDSRLLVVTLVLWL
jgi:hypothetical protein